MLRIREYNKITGEKIDLKELEKFGYYSSGNCYMKSEVTGVRYFINKNTREITRLHPYDLREIPTENEISDLITAGYVEKVEEK